MDERYIQLVAGIIFVAAAILLAWKGKAYARFNARMIRRIYGNRAERVARSSTPGTVLFVSIAMLVLGISFLVSSIAKISA